MIGFKVWTLKRVSYKYSVHFAHPMMGWALLLSMILFLSACSSHKSNVRHKLKVSYENTYKLDSSLHGVRRDIVKEALSWEGTPYQYANWEKGKGSDCSGLVAQVYVKTTGVKLPRNSAKQAEFCKRIKEKDVKPGDLVFFATGKDPDRISHVGIMLDNTRFIHSSTSRGVVITDVTTPYWTRTFKMYGRVPGL